MKGKSDASPEPVSLNSIMLQSHAMHTKDIIIDNRALRIDDVYVALSSIKSMTVTLQRTGPYMALCWLAAASSMPLVSSAAESAIALPANATLFCLFGITFALGAVAALAFQRGELVIQTNAQESCRISGAASFLTDLKALLESVRDNPATEVRCAINVRRSRPNV